MYKDGYNPDDKPYASLQKCRRLDPWETQVAFIGISVSHSCTTVGTTGISAVASSPPKPFVIASVFRGLWLVMEV